MLWLYNIDILFSYRFFRHKQAKWTVCFAKWPYGCYDLCILPSYQKGVLEFIVYWFHQLLGFPDSKLLVLSYMWAAWVIYMLLWLIMMNVTNRLGALVRSLRVNILKGVFGINTCEQMLDKSSYIDTNRLGALVRSLNIFWREFLELTHVSRCWRRVATFVHFSLSQQQVSHLFWCCCFLY